MRLRTKITIPEKEKENEDGNDVGKGNEKACRRWCCPSSERKVGTVSVVLLLVQRELVLGIVNMYSRS